MPQKNAKKSVVLVRYAFFAFSRGESDVFRISGFGLLSAFDLRISDFRGRTLP
jgi:hypothetical protein